MNSIKDRLPATLTTDRLVLTTPTLAHVPEMAVLANNQAIYEVLSRLPHPYAESDGRFFVEEIARGPEEFAWAILLEGRYIGGMGLHLLPDQLPELGYWLGEPHWGKGYATEAAHAVIAAAREAGYPALRSRALLSNTGSRNVLRKVGFIETGEVVDQAGTLVGKTMAHAVGFRQMNVTLRTPHFVLRPAQVGDAEAIARYLNDFAVAGNLARVPFPYHLSDAKAWLRSRKPNLPVEETNFSIELPGEGLAGHVGFHMGPQGPIIGYWLGQPFWGRGIMTTAVTASLDWFFDTTNAETIYSGVFHFNAASLAIQRKLGFTETGRSTLLCLARGAEVEHIDTKLTQSVWKARKNEVS